MLVRCNNLYFLQLGRHHISTYNMILQRHLLSVSQSFPSWYTHVVTVRFNSFLPFVILFIFIWQHHYLFIYLFSCSVFITLITVVSSRDPVSYLGTHLSQQPQGCTLSTTPGRHHIYLSIYLSISIYLSTNLRTYLYIYLNLIKFNFYYIFFILLLYMLDRGN